ncbi:hypothetical protein [Microbacterium sp. KR10-403]|uniref:hypothetical protein n=1 Tax=Microbacterium sp. KR10-403 TaxID=3158581 RepID=UPI0032E4D325
MNDITVAVADAASLSRLGRVLGEAGVSLEGGGLWAGVAHYLVADGEAARRALRGAGITDVDVREAVVVPLDADVPGALGRMMDRLAAAGVTLIAQYTDHDNRKVLVVDDPPAAREALA